MPESMRDHSVEQVGDWMPWKSVGSTVTANDIRDIENELSLPMPDLYRSFLQHKHHFNLWSPSVRFPSFPVDQWRKELRMLHTAFEPERTVGQGYLPFASEAFGDAGLIFLTLEKCGRVTVRWCTGTLNQWKPTRNIAHCSQVPRPCFAA